MKLLSKSQFQFKEWTRACESGYYAINKNKKLKFYSSNHQFLFQFYCLSSSTERLVTSVLSELNSQQFGTLEHGYCSDDGFHVILGLPKQVFPQSCWLTPSDGWQTQLLMRTYTLCVCVYFERTVCSVSKALPSDFHGSPLTSKSSLWHTGFQGRSSSVLSTHSDSTHWPNRRYQRKRGLQSWNKNFQL